VAEPLAVRVEHATDKSESKRSLLRVPTPIVVTLLGALLTVWLAPAFTRQWDDRQSARDLKAALAEDMVSSAARTIREGAPLAEGQGRFDAILGRWLESGLKVQVREKAFFAAPIVERWKDMIQDVKYFLIVCDDVSRTLGQSQGMRPRGAAAVADYRYQRIADSLKLLAPTQAQAESAALQLASPLATTRAAGMDDVKSWMFAKVEAVTDEVLSAQPSGFSTTRADLLHDLLP
jgi:hypothetical protein